MSDWKVYTGNGGSLDEDPLERLPPPPPWRQFNAQHRAESLRPTLKAVQMVNMALYLRRPLLITGKPGTGKSSLAYAVAEELKLGVPLVWPINTRTTLQDGLYRYDALARLRDTQLHGLEQSIAAEDIGRYIRLGPLGTALLPAARPRMLLIDEIDKGDVDLPNDLLHVFEEGEFVIPEIVRLLPTSGGDHNDQQGNMHVKVWTHDNRQVAIPSGHVHCTAFPLVFMTSNGERDFPPAFLRRCLRLDIAPPKDVAEVEEIVRAHLEQGLYQQQQPKILQAIRTFLSQRDNMTTQGHIATDQLLNLIYVVTRNVDLDPDTERQITEDLLKKLGSEL